VKRKRWMVIIAGLAVFSSPLFAQEKGAWRPVGTAAKYTTGFVVFSDGRISIAGKLVTVAQTRQLKHDEISAIFRLDLPFAGLGNLYRVRIPRSKNFAHKNTICNTDEAKWLATFVEGDDLDPSLLLRAHYSRFLTRGHANPLEPLRNVPLRTVDKVPAR
jgi:hypothetical protein